MTDPDILAKELRERVNRWSHVDRIDVDREELIDILCDRDALKARAEHAESFCYQAAKASGNASFVCSEAVAMRAERDALKAELARAKAILAECGNAAGGAVAAECSLDFMAHIPGEIRARIAHAKETN